MFYLRDLECAKDTEDTQELGQFRAMGVLLSSIPMNGENMLNVPNVLKIL